MFGLEAFLHSGAEYTRIHRVTHRDFVDDSCVVNFETNKKTWKKWYFLTKADKTRRISFQVLGEIEGEQNDGEPDDESLNQSDEAIEMLEDESAYSSSEDDIVLA